MAGFKYRTPVVNATLIRNTVPISSGEICEDLAGEFLAV
jgi:hypothetical protein